MKVLALPARRVKVIMMLMMMMIMMMIQGPEMPGVLMSTGDIWHQQRRFTLRTLRDFGFGKQGIFIHFESISRESLCNIFRNPILFVY